MDATELADNIRRLIDDKGMKIKVAANRAGFTEQQFSNILCGRNVIRAEYMPGIAAALGVGIEEIYECGTENA